MKKECSNPFGSDCFLSGAENYPLCKAMVNHDQQRVKAGGKGKVSDEVTGDLLEGARSMGFDQGEWGNGGVCVGLVLLAQGAAFDIFSHELCETRPPEFRGNKLASFEVARVTGGFMVVATGKDRAAEGVLQGNIDTTLVGQDVIVELPV